MPDRPDWYGEPDAQAADARTPETDLQARERSTLLGHAFSGLTQEHKVILYLRFQHGGTLDEIAYFLGKSHTSVARMEKVALRRMKINLALMGIKRGDLC